MCLTADNPTSSDGRKGFINERLRPSHIVAFLGRPFGDALVYELSHGFLYRLEVATRHMRGKPFVLLGCEGDAHSGNLSENPRYCH